MRFKFKTKFPQIATVARVVIQEIAKEYQIKNTDTFSVEEDMPRYSATLFIDAAMASYTKVSEALLPTDVRVVIGVALSKSISVAKESLDKTVIGVGRAIKISVAKESPSTA